MWQLTLKVGTNKEQDRGFMIWEATTEDVTKFSKLSQDFMSATKFVKVDDEVFAQTWTNVLTSGIGKIFILDDFHGALGALAYQDPNDGELVATEMFWIVSPEHRGKGMELLKAFEHWAKSIGCKRTIMVHLKDSMPDKLKTIYKRNKYVEMETHYIKEL
jgi:GNAT superfamily N-acetyltransferase